MSGFTLTLEDAMKKLIGENHQAFNDEPDETVNTTYFCADCRSEVQSDGDLCKSCELAHKRGYKVGYKGGRCWNGAHRDAGRVNHALPVVAGDTSFDTAVCGTKPGARSYGWVLTNNSEAVTCERCLKKMTDQQKAGQITDKERELMAHAQQSGFFGTGKSGDDYDLWLGIVAKGLATKRNAAAWMIDDYMFFLTGAGRACL